MSNPSREETISYISRTIEFLKTSTSISSSDGENGVLSNIFNTCLKLRDCLEDCDLPTNDETTQTAVKTCITSLENCTRMVNSLDLFSTNETYDELQTSSIKYLLLPALLGHLNILLLTKSSDDRIKCVEISEVYLKDFLARCKNYEISSANLNHFGNTNGEDENFDHLSTRDRKIAQFKQKMELEKRLKELKPVLERPEDEEHTREYFFTLLEKWIILALDELENIKNEKKILMSMPKKKDVVPEKAREIKPLQPFIITKNEVEKKVFGLGYPSVPVLTIDDFYRQRFEKVVEEQKAANRGKSLQESALSGQGLDKESEDIAKEELLDKDDPTELMKARGWDDWKDDNPRGAGNRWNKG